MERDIYLLYLLRALRGSMLFMPIIVPFFKQNGMSMFQIFLLQGTFSAVILLLEIPSGWVADWWGRKQSLVTGTAIGAVGIGMYAGSSTFLGFFLAEFVLGVGSALTSGAYGAYLYDTLYEHGHADEYLSRQGMLSGWASYAEAAGSVIGGVLAGVSLRTPFYVQTGLIVIAVVVASLLREPARARPAGGEHWGRIRAVVRETFEDDALRWLTLYTGFVGAGTLTAWWFAQEYFGVVGLPVVFYGVAWAVLNGSVGVFSTVADRYAERAGKRIGLILVVLFVAVGFALLGTVQSLYGVVFVLFFAAARGFNKPLVRTYTNERISSDTRATVLSVQKFTGRLTFTLCGPLLGLVSDVWSVATALRSAAVLFLVLGGTAVAFLYKNDVI